MCLMAAHRLQSLLHVLLLLLLLLLLLAKWLQWYSCPLISAFALAGGSGLALLLPLAGVRLVSQSLTLGSVGGCRRRHS